MKNEVAGKRIHKAWEVMHILRLFLYIEQYHEYQKHEIRRFTRLLKMISASNGHSEEGVTNESIKKTCDDNRIIFSFVIGFCIRRYSNCPGFGA